MIWDRDNKNQIRKKALRVRGDITAKTALMLPGDQCQCVRDALTCGLFSPGKTRLVAVEREKAKIDGISAQLTELIPKFQLHNSELHELRLPPDSAIDYAFLDICGNMTREIAWWMYGKIEPGTFAEGAAIRMTTCVTIRRGKGLLNAFWKRLGGHIVKPLHKNLFCDDSNWIFAATRGASEEDEESHGIESGVRNKLLFNYIFSCMLIQCATERFTQPEFSDVYRDHGHSRMMCSGWTLGKSIPENELKEIRFLTSDILARSIE